MAVHNYDSPRTAVLEPPAESLGSLRERPGTTIDDLAEPDPATLDDLPDLEAIDDEMMAPVVPVGADEFRCGRCFLVLHRVLRAGSDKSGDLCRDCV